MHKIRKAMQQCDDRYTLTGIVEIDDTFISASTEGGKRGRNTEKTKAVASLSLTNAGYPVCLKMKVVDDLDSSTLFELANQNITIGSVISTDL